MILNILYVPPRYESIKQEMQKHNITCVYWEGQMGGNVKQNISEGHKRIVQFAKNNNLSHICIGEDDIEFFGEGAYQYFIDNMPEDFDIYLGGYYRGFQTEDRVKGFRGLSIYIVSARFFDKFLSADPTKNIDTALNMQGGVFKVCPKFVVKQLPGYSYNKGSAVNYDYMLEGRPKYGE